MEYLSEEPISIKFIASNDSSDVDLLEYQQNQQVIRKTLKLRDKYIQSMNIIELDIMTMLKCAPHISQLIDINISPPTDESPTITMFLQPYDGDLLSYKGHLDVKKVLQDISMAMYICQSLNVVHYDIKPSNIFYKQHDRYIDFYLADFGLSALRGVDVSVRGSRGYLAPELLIDIDKLPYAHDSFSLGITICNVLAKRMLIPKDVRALRKFYNNSIHIDISSIEHLVDLQTYEILKSLCSFYPEDRCTPKDVLNEYNIPLPDLEHLYIAYPKLDIDSFQNQHNISEVIATEICNRLSTNDYPTAHNIAKLRIGDNIRLSTSEWILVLNMLKQLNYRIYNPYLTDILHQKFN